MLPSSYYLNVFVRSETIFAYNVTRTWVCPCIEQTYCLSLPCFKYIKKSQYLHEYIFTFIYNLYIHRCKKFIGCNNCCIKNLSVWKRDIEYISFTQYYEIDITLRSTRYDLLIGDGMHKMSWRDLPSWIPPPPLLVICVQMSAHDLISKPYFIVRFDENVHFLFLSITIRPSCWIRMIEIRCQFRSSN